MYDRLCSDEELLRHLAALDRWHIEAWPRLTGEQRVAFDSVFDRLVEARATRRRAHEQRLVSTARRLGRAVRRHEVTVADADAQLDRLALTLDSDSPRVAIVPYRQGVALLRDAFAEGCRHAHS
jgi:hypothetical protein